MTLRATHGIIPTAVLFAFTRSGLLSGYIAPAGFVSDMPAFGPSLSDEDIIARAGVYQEHLATEDRSRPGEVTEQYAARK